MKIKQTTINMLMLAAMMASPPAFAADKDETSEPVLRERISCFPAKNIIKFMSKFQKIDADKRDTVDMVFDAEFEAKDGGVLPERIFLRDDGVETDFTLNADGSVPDFGKITMASETSEMCADDPSREGQPRTGEELRFGLESDVQFLKNTGYHDIAALEDGLKDGKSHFKKMAPGPMRMLVPKLTFVMIQYQDEAAVPEFTATLGQKPIEGLGFKTFCDNAMIKIKDLKALGADGLQVTGGAYKLMPVPGPKTLAKFAGCADDEVEESEKQE